MNRRGFLKGLLTTIAATPAVKLAGRVAETAIVKPIRKTWAYFAGKPLLNSGAWDAQYKTYDEAKKASDEIASAVMRKMLNR